MGFDNIYAHLIIFIAVITTASAVAIGLKGYVDSASGSASFQQKLLSEKIETDITIEVVNFDENQNKLSVYAKNTGSAKISPDQVDLFINKIRVPRSSENRSIEVISDTDSINTNIWDPGEQILINTNATLDTGESHDVTITTGNGITDLKTFSV